MDRMEENRIHSRNLLLVKLIVAVYILGTALRIIIDRSSFVLQQEIGIPLCAILLLFVMVKKWPRITMYLTAISIYVYIFMLITFRPFPVNYIFMWSGIVLLSLYQDYSVILLSAFSSIGMTIYFFYIYNSEIFYGAAYIDLAYLLGFGVLLTFIFMLYTRFTRDLRQTARHSQEQLKSVINSVDMATWSFDIETKRVSFSSGIEKITGLPAETFEEKPGMWEKIIHPDDVLKFIETFKDLNSENLRTFEYRIVHSDGGVRWVQSRGVIAKDYSGSNARMEGVVLDITERKKMEKKIEHVAYHDTLTGLPNRALLSKNFYNKLEMARYNKNKMAVMFIDIDHFKLVNDTLGHDIGDFLLKGAAKRLKDNLRKGDMLSRMGGDEFIALVERATEREFNAIAERIVNAFSSPFYVEGYRVFISCSVGVSIYPADGEDIEVLIKNADNAMYLAKKSGRNNYKFYQEHEPLPAVGETL